jgi:antitoxin HicB
MTEPEVGRPGSTLDDFLAEEGILEEATEHAVKSVLAWQIGEAIRERNLSVAPTQQPAKIQK